MRNADMPAMPLDNASMADSGLAGLTKREYFAAIALQGLIASDDDGAGDRIDELPRYAIQIADAILEELENDNA